MNERPKQVISNDSQHSKGGKLWKKCLPYLIPALIGGIITIYVSEKDADKIKAQIVLVNDVQKNVDRFPELADPLLGKIDSDVSEIKVRLENTERNNIKENHSVRKRINKLTEEFEKLESKVDSMLVKIELIETDLIDSNDYYFYTTVIEQPHKSNIFKRFVHWIKGIFRKKEKHRVKNTEAVMLSKQKLQKLETRIISLRNQFDDHIRGIDQPSESISSTPIDDDLNDNTSSLDDFGMATLSSDGEQGISEVDGEIDNGDKSGHLKVNEFTIKRDSLRSLLRNSKWGGEIAFNKNVLGKENVKAVYFLFHERFCRTNYFNERYGIENDTLDLMYKIDTTYEGLKVYLLIKDSLNSYYFSVSKIPSRKQTILKFGLLYKNKTKITDPGMINRFSKAKMNR